MLTCLLLSTVSLLVGCEDKTYPGYYRGSIDRCEELTCTEGVCDHLRTAVPICVPPGPDGSVGEDLPEPPYRLALPATFTPLPTTGAPVEGTLEESPIIGDSADRYFEFEATGEHVYRLTMACENMGDCRVYVADAQGMAFHEASSASSDDPEFLDCSFRPVRAGRQVIAFSPHNAQRVNRYSLQLQAIADDHGDLAETATPLSQGNVTFEGTLQARADTDVFSFSAQAGERLQVLCTFPGVNPGAAFPATVSSVSGKLPAEGPAEDGVVRTTESGPHFIHLSQGSGTEAPLQYRCGLRNLTHDDHGDTLAEATPLGASARVEGWFESRGDVDVFQVELDPDSFYLVSCHAPGGGSCSLRVANAAGGVLVERVNAAIPDTLAVVPLSAGVHQLQVRGAGVHGYQLLFSLGGTDEHGDTAEQATLLQTGSLDAELQGPGDIDFFAFDALATHSYLFTCISSVTSSPSLSLVLRNAHGEAVSSTAPPGTRVEVRAQAAERYTVQVQGADERRPVPHRYSCTLEDRGQDAHGNTPGQATAVTLPATLRGRLEVSTDVDVYAFTGTARRFVGLRLESSTGEETSGSLRLRDAAGNMLASTHAQTTLSHRLEASGTYFVEVRGTPIDYTLSIQDQGPDDHGDTLETATALSLGVTASGVLQSDWDQDFFSLPATAGRFYRLTCVPEEASPYDECFFFVQGTHKWGFDGTSTPRYQHLFDVSASGTVGIGIGGRGAFTLRVEEAMLDDHGGQPARATPLTLGSPLAWTLEASIDEDFFVMPLEPEGRYRLQLTAGFRINYTAQDPLTGSSFYIAPDETFVAGSSTQVLIRVLPYFAEAGPTLGSYQVRIDRSSL